MNHLVLLLSLLASATAQRSPYAGSAPVGIPNVASRFANTSTATDSTASGTNLADRLGTDSSSPTIRIPIDARGDVELVKRVETWPRENQPFWLINADHLDKQRHPDGVRVTGNVPAGNSGQDNSSSTQMPAGQENSSGSTQVPAGIGGQDSSSGSTQMPVNNQTQSGQSKVSSQATVNDRGSFDTPQATNGAAENSFTIFRDNQLKTYVYDPVSDSWTARTN